MDFEKWKYFFWFRMSVEPEKSKSSVAAAKATSQPKGITPVHRKAILKRSGGVESEITEDVLYELTQWSNPDLMDPTKTATFPVISDPKYQGQLTFKYCS